MKTFLISIDELGISSALILQTRMLTVVRHFAARTPATKRILSRTRLCTSHRDTPARTSDSRTVCQADLLQPGLLHLHLILSVLGDIPVAR
jgi:hypothetical protein